MPSESVTVKYLRIYTKDSLRSIYKEKELESVIQILFDHYLGFSKIDCITMAESFINVTIARKIEYAVQKLQYGIPVQYVIGQAHFYNLDFYLDRNVLIPRKETEELVHWIINDINIKIKDQKKFKIIDIGTGSGCIAIVLKKNLDFADIDAIDISEKALKVAKRNADLHNISIRFLNYDILSENIKLSQEKYDVIVSNPPYIEEKDMKILGKNVLNFEPHRALFVPDDDPLLFYKSIIDFSLANLKRNGKLYFEINEKFGREIINILKEKGFRNIFLKKDINNKDRMISAEL